MGEQGGQLDKSLPEIGTEMTFGELPYNVVYQLVEGGCKHFTMVKHSGYGYMNHYAKFENGKWRATMSGMKVEDDAEVRVIGYVEE